MRAYIKEASRKVIKKLKEYIEIHEEMSRKKRFNENVGESLKSIMTGDKIKY